MNWQRWKIVIRWYIQWNMSFICLSMKTFNFMVHRILFLYSRIGALTLFPIHSLFIWLRWEWMFLIGKNAKIQAQSIEIMLRKCFALRVRSYKPKKNVLNNEFKMCFGCVSFHPTREHLDFVHRIICVSAFGITKPTNSWHIHIPLFFSLFLLSFLFRSLSF